MLRIGNEISPLPALISLWPSNYAHSLSGLKKDKSSGCKEKSPMTWWGSESPAKVFGTVGEDKMTRLHKWQNASIHTRDMCLEDAHPECVRKDTATFKNDLLFFGLKIFLKDKIDMCAWWCEFSQMKPFFILHSVTGILTGCDYINSPVIFPWVTDHMHFFGCETDSKFRSENLCVCVI